MNKLISTQIKAQHVLFNYGQLIILFFYIFFPVKRSRERDFVNFSNN